MIYQDREPGAHPSERLTQRDRFPSSNNDGQCDAQTYRNRQFAEIDSPPLYRFGDGRSYAEFTYSSLHVAPTSPIGVCDDITVSVSVTNPEAVAADEVVQVYTRCPCGYAACQAGTCDSAAMQTPPLTALLGFRRVTVPANSTQTVRVTISARQRARFRPVSGVGVGMAMVEEVRGGELWLTVGGGQLGSSTASAVLQTRLQIGGNATPVANCL